MFQEVGPEEPRTEWLVRVEACIGEDKEDESVAESIEDVEARRGDEGTDAAIEVGERARHVLDMSVNDT